jgi:hypothetical protein
MPILRAAIFVTMNSSGGLPPADEVLISMRDVIRHAMRDFHFVHRLWLPRFS